MLTHIDLFSGIGGFSLGLERTGHFQTTAFCEIDPFCQKVLRKHWPDVPVLPDIRDIEVDEAGRLFFIDENGDVFVCQQDETEDMTTQDNSTKAD